MDQSKKYPNTKPLREAAIQLLAKEGWKIEPIKGRGITPLAQVRISRGSESYACCVKVAATRWVSFFPLVEGGWRTLSNVDRVIVAAFDNRENPKAIDVYMLEQSAVLASFEAMKKAWEEAGKNLYGSLPPYVCLDTVTGVPTLAAGSGFKSVAIWSAQTPRDPSQPIEVDLDGDEDPTGKEADRTGHLSWGPEDLQVVPQRNEPLVQPGLTLQQAKEGLARTFGVSPEAIEITIRG